MLSVSQSIGQRIKSYLDHISWPVSTDRNGSSLRYWRQRGPGGRGMGERFAAVCVRHAPPGGRAMRVRRAESDENAVCGPAPNGRILNYDHYGRSFRLPAFGRPRGVRRLTVLSELKVGESGVLVALDLPESVQNHLMHMGFVPDALVTALRRAPAGDPTVYGVD